MTASTFAQRFAFARLVQALHGRTEGDQDFATAVGLGASSITDYKSRVEAPPVDRVLAIALRCGVDPGWLAFGAASKAPEPQGWTVWFENNREPERPIEKRGAKMSKGGIPVPQPGVANAKKKRA